MTEFNDGFSDSYRSQYNCLPEPYRFLFKKYNLPFSYATCYSYPDELLKSMLFIQENSIELKKLKPKGGITEEKRASRGNSVAIWTLLKDLKITNKNQLILRQHKIPNNVAELIRDHGGGKIQEAINIISILIEYLESQYTQHDLHPVNFFLHDVLALVSRFKNKPRGKNEAAAYLRDFCTFCHRIKPSNKTYCMIHTPDNPNNLTSKISSNLFSTRRKLIEKVYEIIWIDKQRIPATNYSYTNEQSEIISTFINGEYVFKPEFDRDEKRTVSQKAIALLGWAKTNDLCLEFNASADEIQREFLPIGDERAWEINHLNMIEKLILLTREHPHTWNLFPKHTDLPKGTESELASITRICNAMLRNPTEIEMDPHEFITSIRRKNYFELIEAVGSSDHELKRLALDHSAYYDLVPF